MRSRNRRDQGGAGGRFHRSRRPLVRQRCHHFRANGLGSEEIIADHTQGQVIRGTTFMSGTKHSDTHVQYELDTATWIGPFEPRGTPFATVKQAAELIVSGGLKAEALPDARPAQWSKLIFNAW